MSNRNNIVIHCYKYPTNIKSHKSESSNSSFNKQFDNSFRGSHSCTFISIYFDNLKRLDYFLINIIFFKNMLKNKRKSKEFVGQRQQYRRVLEAINNVNNQFAAVSNRPSNINNSTDMLNITYNILSCNTNVVTVNDKTDNNENTLEKIITCSDLQYDNNVINAVSNCSKSLNNSSYTDVNSQNLLYQNIIKIVLKIS